MDITDANDASMRKNVRIIEMIPLEENFATLSIDTAIDADLSSIVEYDNGPLLPLAKACVPLVSIIYNILFCVQVAINETPEVPPDGLTIDESAALRLYTMEWSKPHHSLYSMLNSTLKMTDRNQLKPYFKYLKLFLTALAKIRCIPQQTIWRGNIYLCIV